MSKNQDITTKYNLDVSGFKKGITEANQSIKLANAQFKASSASMDDWSKSAEGIKAKLTQLDSVLVAQNKKLDSYTKQQEEMDKAYSENGKRAEELKAKLKQLSDQGISKTSAEFQKYQKALNEVEKEQQANKKASDDMRITILNQQSVINKTKKEIQNYETSLKDVEKAEKLAAKSGKSVEDSLKEISQGAEETEKKLDGLAGQLAGGIRKGLAGLATAAAGVVTAFLATGEASQGFIEDMGKLETGFTTSGHSAETAKKTYEDFVGILGETDQSVEAANHLAKLTKNEKELAKWGTITAGVYGTFGDSLPIEGLTEAANETAKVGQVTGPLADALNWAGISEEKFNKQLEKCNSEQERATLITNTLNKVYGEAGKKYKEVNKDLIEARKANSDMSEAMAEMGKIAMPIITALKKGFANFLKEVTPKIKEFLQNVDWDEFATKVENALKKVAEGFGWILDNKDTIVAALASIVAGFLAFKVVTIIQSVTNALKSMTIAQAALNLVMSANPIGLVIAAVAGLVTGFILLWNKSEAFKEFWIKLWETIKTTCSKVIEAIKVFFRDVWENLKNGAKNAWSNLKNGAKNAWEGIKSTFSKVSSFFRETFQNAWQKVKDVFSTGGKIFDGIKDGIVSSFKSIVNAIIRGINKVIKIPFDKINNVLTSIRNAKFLGIQPFSGLGSITVPVIPELAKGGILKKGQVGLLEGNGAEAVVPLEKNKYWIKKVANELKEKIGLSGLNVTQNIPRENKNVIYFTQNNNSPKSLSRFEIYRQTKNALANIQGV